MSTGQYVLLWTAVGMVWVALQIPVGMLVGRVLARRSLEEAALGDFVAGPHDVGKTISEVAG